MVNDKMVNNMRRVYFSPATETMPMHLSAVLCASDTTGTPFGVDNTPANDLIIS